MTKEYLKMADVFPCGTIVDTDQHYNGWAVIKVKYENQNTETIDESGDGGFYEKTANYISHAINSHDELVAEVERLREFERDAMRYRWLMQNTKLGIGRNGKDWDLQVDGPAPDSISEVGEWIDNRMDGMM